ncbi:hypothetical protein [Acinetobacter modestus]
MEMIKSRNQSSHTYNEAVIKVTCEKVNSFYHPLFILFESKMYSLVEYDD